LKLVRRAPVTTAPRRQPPAIEAEPWEPHRPMAMLMESLKSM
jgi:hypothetical protein